MQLRAAVTTVWLLTGVAPAVEAQDAGAVRTLWAAAEDGATISPDGRVVAFIDWNSGEVAVRDLETGTVTPVTDRSVVADGLGFPEPFIVFSPDGDRVVFPFGNPLGGEPFRYELRTAGTRDAVQKLLAAYPPDVEFVAPFDWAAGAGILFTVVAADGSSELLIIDPDAGDVRVVEKRPAGSGIIDRALFTPDGRGVVYLVDGWIRQVSLHGGLSRSPGIAAEALLGWSSDGRTLLFHAAREGVVGNWSVVLREDGEAGAPTLELTTTEGVLAAGQSSEGVAYLEPASAPGMFVVKLDIDEGRVLQQPETIALPFAGIPGNPAWSRDGSRLAFTLRAPNRTRHRVMVLDSPGALPREIAPVDLRVMGLDWSVDARHLIIGGRAATRQLAWAGRIEISTGVVERLAPVPVNAVAAGTGQGMAYVRAAPAGERTVRVTYLAEPGATPRVLATYVAAELPRSMSVSPDGRWVALIKSAEEGRASVLQLLATDTEAERTLLRLERPDAFELNVGSLPWTAKGDGVLVAMRRSGRRQLAVVRVESGEITSVPFSPRRGGRWQPALRPGGTDVIYIDGVETNDLKLMPRPPDRGR